MDQEMNRMKEEECDKSNRVSPRRHLLKKFEQKGIKIKDSKEKKIMLN